jgi:hypothetical protein
LGRDYTSVGLLLDADLHSPGITSDAQPFGVRLTLSDRFLHADALPNNLRWLVTDAAFPSRGVTVMKSKLADIVLAAVAVLWGFTSPAAATTATFNFDTDTVGTATPFADTNNASPPRSTRPLWADFRFYPRVFTR